MTFLWVGFVCESQARGLQFRYGCIPSLIWYCRNGEACWMCLSLWSWVLKLNLWWLKIVCENVLIRTHTYYIYIYVYVCIYIYLFIYVYTIHIHVIFFFFFSMKFWVKFTTSLVRFGPFGKKYISDNVQ